MPQVTAPRVVACDWQEARAARRTADERRVAEGYQLLVMGGESADDAALTAALDRALAQHPDTLVLRTGNRRGVQTLAAAWGLEHGVPCVLHVLRWQEGAKRPASTATSPWCAPPRAGRGGWCWSPIARVPDGNSPTPYSTACPDL